MSTQMETTKTPAARALKPAGMHLLQRKCACGGSSGLRGECAECSRKRLLGAGSIALQTKLAISEPGDRYEREADQVAEQVMHASEPQILRKGSFVDAYSSSLPLRLSRSEASHMAATEVPPGVHEVLSSQGQPLPDETRAFFEPRFGHDFSRVRVHTDAKARESARAVSALAYTVGNDVVFGTGQYAPETTTGRGLVAHELTHVVQQATSIRPRVQRFTAELADSKVYIKPEKGDTDADLDRILCTGITERRIAGRTKIDVTSCLPEGTIKAMGLGPHNCAEFVRRAMGETPPKAGPDAKWLFTTELWQELLRSGYRIRGFGVVKEDGKVEPAQGLSWKQLSPRMGDLVFMIGEIRVKDGAGEPDPAGDNFKVNWDHVAFFIVRSRKGFDYHLAKDGDENPIGVYHTGSEPAEGLSPGAYVGGVESLSAYVGIPASEMKEDFYAPGEMSRLYETLSPEERATVNAEVDRMFQKETGVTRQLDWNDPKDRPLARKWLNIRDEAMSKRVAGPSPK